VLYGIVYGIALGVLHEGMTLAWLSRGKSRLHGSSRYENSAAQCAAERAAVRDPAGDRIVL